VPIAYNSNIAATSGTTTLYDIDFRNNVLAIQNPPNNGTLTQVGSLGLTVSALSGSGFDIYIDPATGTDSAFAVIKRPDAPIGGPLGAYLLYDVNLTTGAIANGRLVGSSAGADFTGGFAVVPEPSAIVLLMLGAAGLGLLLRTKKLVSAVC
jgi:hypothetical protein